MRLSLILAVALFATTVARAAPPEDNPFLAQARAFYLGLDYQKCAERVRQARSWENTRPQLAELELYAGLCAFGLRREIDALEHFTEARRLDPTLQIPPHSSPKIREMFDSVAPPAPPVTEVPSGEPPTSGGPDEPENLGTGDSPPPDAVTPKRPPPPSRQVAQDVERPFIVRPLTWVLGGAAVVATGTGVLFGIRARQFEAVSRSGGTERNIDSASRSSIGSSRAANISYGVALTMAAAAVISYFVLDSKEVPP